MGGSEKGMTLVEVVVAVGLVGAAALVFTASFAAVQRGIEKTKLRTIAIELCREKMEQLKELPYGQVRPTTQADLDAYGFDHTFFTPELGLWSGGRLWDRYVRVARVRNGATGVVELAPSSADSGLKKLDVWVEWQEEGTTRRYEATSLLDNPARPAPSGSLSGTVYAAPGGPGHELAGALVAVVQDPARADVSAADGSYSMTTASGSLSVQASRPGYFTSAALAAASPSANVDLVLSPRGTGSVSGFAYLRDHVVISAVAASTVEPDGFEAQYVELYNPTTASVVVGNSVSHSLRLEYSAPSAPYDCPDLALVYVSTAIAPSSFYLIANTSTFVVGGATLAADAYFSDAAGAGCTSTPPGWSPPASRRLLQPDAAGSLVLTGPQAADALGWTAGASLPPRCEGACFALPAGLAAGEELVRLSSAAASPGGAAGPAWDSGSNAADFAGPPALPGLSVLPRSSASPPQAPAAGTPAFGAVVSADDDLSSPSVIVSATGYFQLDGVATCTATGAPATWDLTVASGSRAGTASFSAAVGGDVDVGAVALTSTAASGFVSGSVVSSTGAALGGILVTAGGSSGITGPGGLYRLVVTAGSNLSVAANPGHAAPGFSYAVSAPFNLIPGQALGGVDFTLDPVGSVAGFVTPDGVSALAGVVVEAQAPAGTTRGATATDALGRFTIDDLPVSSLPGVGAYSVAPALDSSQASSPCAASASLAQGLTVDVGTFTVSGAMASITGSVQDGGQPVSSGVLIMATQVAVSTSPPVWDETLRGGATLYYTAHAAPDGTYTLAVRVSPTPYNVYAWYTKPSGAGASTSVKSASQLVSAPSALYTVSFSWP